MDIRAIQHQAWENKLTKGFNVNDVALEFGLLTAEVGEAFTAWRMRLPDFGEELADILIYLAGLAEMNTRNYRGLLPTLWGQFRSTITEGLAPEGSRAVIRIVVGRDHWNDPAATPGPRA